MRHIPHGADPRVRPQPPGDNRWQRGRVVDALYLADSEETVWAEWYRHLAEHGLPPVQGLPRDLWRYRVPQVEVADLTTRAKLGRVGLSAPRPGRGDWPAYQQVGETLWREGWTGLLTRSAARPSGLILCLFTRDGALPARPSGRPRIVRQPPAPPTGMRT